MLNKLLEHIYIYILVGYGDIFHLPLSTGTGSDL
jgi:hypothetical protein